MLERFMIRGAQDACATLKLAAGEAGMLSGLLSKAKSFGAGQLQAGKDLFSNLRGGLGGQLNPDVLPAPGGDLAATRAAHRTRALGNIKTLAPSLLAGGGLYMMHRKQQQEEQARQQAMMQGGYGQPMM
jgi:hypothetical protein